MLSHRLAHRFVLLAVIFVTAISLVLFTGTGSEGLASLLAGNSNPYYWSAGSLKWSRIQLAQPQPEPEARPPKSDRTKLLILAYPRTGSSFSGKIFSANPNSSYVFEPLFRFEPFGHPVDFWSKWNWDVIKEVENYIEGLFNCHNDSLAFLQARPFGGKAVNMHWSECNYTSLSIIKTIRLHRINMDPWIYKSDIKIIHLIRDPRAMINSMSKLPGTWNGTLNHIDGMCARMINDTLLGESLPYRRYYRLKYEHLVETPISTMVDLYERLELPFDVIAADALYNHTRIIPEAKSKVDYNKYYSTYRGADNDHNKWMREMKLDLIRKVEANCAELMEKVGYPIFESEKHGRFPTEPPKPKNKKPSMTSTTTTNRPPSSNVKQKPRQKVDKTKGSKAKS